MLFLYDYFCILWNIHLTHARSCSCRHTLSLVCFYTVVRSWASCICPHHWCRNPGHLKVLGRSRASVGQVLLPLVVCFDRLDVVTCGVTRWLGRGCRAAWLGVGCSGQPVGQGAHVDVVVVLGLCGGLSAAIYMFWRQRGPWGVRHGEHRTLGFMCILLLVLAACFGGAACLTFGRPGCNVTDIYVGGLRQVGCDAHVPCGCLDQLIFTWNGTMSRNPELRLIASKGWVVRATKSLNELLEKPDITVVALNHAIDEFDKRLASFDDIQSELELTIETEEALLDCVNKAADFREKARVSRVNATSKLLELTQSDQDAVDKSTCVSTADVKLPKLTLPKFSGDVLEWQSFWDQFKVNVHDSDLPVVSKFSYLLSLLQGEAKQAVQGLSMTSDHYKTACKILEDRYGRTERIIFTHIQKLLNITIPSKCSISVLWKLNDDLQAHTRSLDALGIDGDKYGVILTPLILSRLPQDIRLEWSREGKGHESDLTFLLEFLQSEIQRRERSHVFKESIASPSSLVTEEKRNVKVATASALQASSMAKTCKTAQSFSCGICSKPHSTDRCFKLLHVPVGTRKEKLRSAGLCFRCLKSGHIARGCSASCIHCQGRHHALLCNPMTSDPGVTSNVNVEQTQPKMPNKDAAKPSNQPVNSEAVTSHTVSFTGVSSATNNVLSPSGARTRVLLQSVRVKVHGVGGVVDATVLFDTGSDRSYITTDLVRKVGPEWLDAQPMSYAAFGTGKPSVSELRNIYNVILESSQGSGHSLHCTEVPVICAPIYRPEVPSDLMSAFGELQFADVYGTGLEVKVDILIGLDSYWKFVRPQIISSADGQLMAQCTVFGWMLYGNVPVSEAYTERFVSHQFFCMNVLDQSFKAFWELYSVGIPAYEESVSCDPTLLKFQEEIKMVDDRYEVALPWKQGFHDRLLNNEKLALSRLSHLSEKLERDPVLKTRYNSAIKDMWDNGIIEEVPREESVGCGPVFYMSHRPVIRESSVSTKVRLVFDASAKGFNGLSLNDCMEVGPCLLSNLTEILLRFRRWQIAITSDIEKAFLQIGVKKDDCDVHRFLWDVDGTTKMMRFARVPFGNCSSPFILNATVQFHLSGFPESRVVEELKENMYVDDFLSGADSVEECCTMVKDAIRIMSQASMPLVKWGSNSPEVAEILHRDFRDKYLDRESFKVLGLLWLASDDCFTFRGSVLAPDLCITKRVVLSFFSKLFDPLGFAAPYVLQAKCLFQELWTLELGWDDEIPPEYQMRFLRWMDGFDVLKSWRISRRYTPGRWDAIRRLQLHAFSDASPKAYGACVYLRAELCDNSIVSSLVMAKSKVAPLKQTTLPRLELLGCLLSARLVKFVREALRFPDDVEYICWTDSMIALSWIKSVPSRWKTFISNRISEIQTLTSKERWSHCPGVDNPADLVTRGISAEELVNSDIWLQGPGFLVEGPWVMEDQMESPGDHSFQSDEAVDAALVSCEPLPPVFPLEWWGTFTKAIRVVAWVQRFIQNLKSSPTDRRKGDLSFDELQAAKQCLIRAEQENAFSAELDALRKGRKIPKCSLLVKLSPFVAEDGFLRVQGRLQFSQLSWEEKHPIILPKSHLTLLLTRFQHSLMKHAGVSAMISSLRNQFWILGVRRLAKRVKRECVHCKRQDSSPCQQPMSPLPDLRVTQSFPFAVTGLDHAGPLYCCDFLGVALYLWGDPCCAPWVSRVAVHWTDIVGITPFSCTSRAATCDLLR